MSLYSTANRAGQAVRFTPGALAAATDLLLSFPPVTPHRSSRILSISPLSIRHASVPPDRADELAAALLALYRRMKDMDACS